MAEGIHLPANWNTLLAAEVPSHLPVKPFSFFNTWKSPEEGKKAGNEVMKFYFDKNVFKKTNANLLKIHFMNR